MTQYGAPDDPRLPAQSDLHTGGGFFSGTASGQPPQAFFPGPRQTPRPMIQIAPEAQAKPMAGYQAVPAPAQVARPQQPASPPPSVGPQVSQEALQEAASRINHKIQVADWYENLRMELWQALANQRHWDAQVQALTRAIAQYTPPAETNDLDRQLQYVEHAATIAGQYVEQYVEPQEPEPVEPQPRLPRDENEISVAALPFQNKKQSSDLMKKGFTSIAALRIGCATKDGQEKLGATYYKTATKVLAQWDKMLASQS